MRPVKRDVKMNVIKKCPACQSTRIKGSVMLEDGQYIQKINCKKCGYSNLRPIGDAERR